jgi:hypothetical protein
MEKVAKVYLKIALLVLCTVFLFCLTASLQALEEKDFIHLATGGFDDSANSYSWGVTEFNGDVYVGTNRHHLWGLLQGMGVLFPPGIVEFIEPEGPSSEIWGDQVWAEDLRGEIWRYRKGEGWTRVYQAQLILGELPIAANPLLPPPPDPPIYGYYPEAYGYRVLGAYNGFIYAIGIGPWVPNMPLASILRSPSGDPGTWEDVSGIIATATNPRGLVEFQGKLFISASLPGTAPAGAGVGVVYCSAEPKVKGWQVVSEPGFGNMSNVEIPYLAVFNGCLYASTVNFNTGFEIWKTDGSKNDDGKYIWTQVLRDGYGDTYNQWGMSMQAFGDYLYVGSAVGGGMVLKDGQPVGTRAIDIIRVDKNDNAELLVGAYFPQDPPPGWPELRTPLSGLPAGFGNPFNVYTWHMAVKDDWLVVATFDAGGMILRAITTLLLENPEAIIQLLQGLDPDVISLIPIPTTIIDKFDLGNQEHIAALLKLIKVLDNQFGGADLWKTKDGINWQPVTLSGFGNSLNYGIRRVVPVTIDKVEERLFVGTANPFTGDPQGGCEVLATKPIITDEGCKGDFDCDGDCDGADAFTFKQDFGRSSLQDPCPPCSTVE